MGYPQLYISSLSYNFLLSSTSNSENGTLAIHKASNLINNLLALFTHHYHWVYYNLLRHQSKALRPHWQLGVDCTGNFALLCFLLPFWWFHRDSPHTSLIISLPMPFPKGMIMVLFCCIGIQNTLPQLCVKYVEHLKSLAPLREQMLQCHKDVLLKESDFVFPSFSSFLQRISLLHRFCAILQTQWSCQG